MPKHHAYIVIWRDSSTYSGWRDVAENHDVAVISSVGWMVRETPRSVTLTTGISQGGKVVDAITIPREAIVKQRKLKEYVMGF